MQEERAVESRLRIGDGILKKKNGIIYYIYYEHIEYTYKGNKQF